MGENGEQTEVRQNLRQYVVHCSTANYLMGIRIFNQHTTHLPRPLIKTYPFVRILNFGMKHLVVMAAGAVSE